MRIRAAKEFEKSSYRKICEHLLKYAYASERLLGPGQTLAELFTTLDRFQQMILISQRASYIQYVHAPDIGMCEEVLTKDPANVYMVPHIKDEYLQHKVILHDPALIKHLEYPCRAIQKLIAEKHSNYISYIKNIDTDILKKAVWNNVNLIQYFRNTIDPTLQLFVVAKDPKLIQYLYYPARIVQEYICQTYKQGIYHIKNIHNDLLEREIRANPELIKQLRGTNVSEELQDFLYTVNPELLSYLMEIHKDLQYRIYNDAPQHIRYVINKCEEIRVHQILDS